MPAPRSRDASTAQGLEAVRRSDDPQESSGLEMGWNRGRSGPALVGAHAGLHEVAVDHPARVHRLAYQGIDHVREAVDLRDVIPAEAGAEALGAKAGHRQP